MGFMKDVGMAALSPLGFALAHKNKTAASITRQPTMINSVTTPQPTSMIGSSRGY